MEHLPSGGTARWFPAHGEGEGTGPTLVTVPAMGVPAAPYRRFAQYLQQRGVTVVTGDYRGQGDSAVPLTRRSHWGYEAHAADVAELIDHVRERRGGEVVLVCHSLGGQVAAVLESARPGHFDRLVLAASGTPFWRAYRGTARGTLLATSTAFATLGRVQGVFEGRRFGFGRQSRLLISQWRHLAWTGRLPGWEPSGRALPLLAVTFAGDGYAPASASADLVRRFPAAHVTRRHLESPTGHAGWLGEPAPLADLVLAWLG